MQIVIVGGGIAGVSAAAALAPHGDVTVLEAEDALGYHASGRSAALFIEDYGCESVVALSKVTGPVLRERDVLGPRGLLMVALEEESDTFDAELAELGMHEISLEEAGELVPILSPNIRRAAFHAGAQDIDTDRLLQGFAADARGHGAVVRTGAKVTDIVCNKRWELRLGDEVVEADIVINAAGAWAETVAGMAGVTKLGLTPFRRSVARMPFPGGHDGRRWPMLFGPGETWWAKADAGAWIVSPAEEDPSEPMDAWADDMVLAEGIARYEAHVSEPVMRVDTNWAGLRTFASDRTLVIGEAPDVAGFYWLAGQGGYGFQTSAGAAQVLAHHVFGTGTNVDAKTVAALHPGRFGA